MTTTTSSSMCITVIGSEVTGTSCLQHTNRNQLNVALFLLLLSSTLSLSLILSRTHRDTSFVFIRVSSKDSGSGSSFLFFLKGGCNGCVERKIFLLFVAREKFLIVNQFSRCNLFPSLSTRINLDKRSSCQVKETR